MEDHYNSAKLHAIYAALDSHNYTRALKLSQHKSVSSWKITLALRCHTLRRLGRKEECIVLLKNDLLSYIKVDPENDEMSILLDRLRRDKGQGDMVQGNNNGNGQSAEVDNSLKRLDFPLFKSLVKGQAESNGGNEVITDEVSTDK